MNGSKNPPDSEDSDFKPWLIEHAPAIIKFIDANPDNVFSKLLAILAGFFFKDGKAEFPPVEAGLEEQLKPKAQRMVATTAAAGAYMDALGNPNIAPPEEIKVRYSGRQDETALKLKTVLNDEDTGFKGAVYTDAGGHSIVFYGGMDVLNGIDMKDAEALAQTRLAKHGVNQQTGPAQKLYEAAVKSSASVEIVGYSLGAMLANDMSARLGAKSTTIADIGLPDVKNTDGHSMYNAGHLQSVADNVEVLKVGKDVYFGAAGNVLGHTNILPDATGSEIVAATKNSGLPFNFNAQSTLTAHHPMAYVLASEKADPPRAEMAPAGPAGGAQTLRTGGA